MTLYRDNALVLRTWKLGESDRIVSMMGEESGKIRAVAKGVRKTKSRFGSRLEPLSLVALLCWRGRELDIVSQAETIELFKQTRNDLDRLYKANVILESVDQIAQENNPDPELYTLAVRVLKVLEAENPPMLVGSYIWRLLTLQGYRPQMDYCASCGAPGPTAGFDATLGGALCSDHAHGRRVSPSSLDVIAKSVQGQLSKVLQIEDRSIVSETEAMALQALEVVLDRKLRSIKSPIPRL